MSFNPLYWQINFELNIEILKIFFTTGEIIFSETLRLINFVSITYNKKITLKI